MSIIANVVAITRIIFIAQSRAGFFKRACNINRQRKDQGATQKVDYRLNVKYCTRKNNLSVIVNPFWNSGELIH